MFLKEDSAERLVIEDRSYILSSLLFLGGCILVFHFLFGSHLNFTLTDYFGASLTITCFFALSAICYTYSYFVFDRNLGEIRWKKQRAFIHSQGTLPFSDVNNLDIDMERTGDGSFSFCLQIHSRTKLIPLSHTYGSGFEYYKKIQRKIIGLLGTGSMTSQIDEVH